MLRDTFFTIKHFDSDTKVLEVEIESNYLKEINKNPLSYKFNTKNLIATNLEEAADVIQLLCEQVVREVWKEENKTAKLESLNSTVDLLKGKQIKATFVYLKFEEATNKKVIEDYNSGVAFMYKDSAIKIIYTTVNDAL